MKKLIAFLLALVLCATLAACGGTAQPVSAPDAPADAAEPAEHTGLPRSFSSANWDGSLPLVPAGEDVTITIGLQTNANVTDFEDNDFTRWVEEQTGVNLEFVMFAASSSDAATQLSLMVAGGEELPDIISGVSGVSKSVAKDYVRDGVFLDLAGYMTDDAYYMSQAMQLYYPDDEARATAEWYALANAADPLTGTVIGVPSLYNNPNDDVATQVWINRDWLDRLGLAKPTTVEELYDVLVAFRDGDPNGNGLKDEIPMAGYADRDVYNITQWVTNAFTFEYDMFKYTVEDGVVDAPYDKDEYRQAMIYLRKLVDEGLLSPLTWTMSTSELNALVNPSGDLTLGVFAGPGDVVFEAGNDSIFSYEALAPLADATGKGGWAPIRCDTAGYGTYITSECENPELAFRLLDFLSSPEAFLRARWGVPDRDWRYLDDGSALPGNLGGQARIELLDPQASTGINNVMWHAGHGGICSEGYWQYAMELGDGSWKSALSLGLQAQIENYANGKQPAQMLYLVERTPENDEAYSDANSDITSYYKTARANFCNGIWDPASDADWNNYVSELEGLGYRDTWIAVAQESWDRDHGLID